MLLNYNNELIQVEIIRSKRTTLSIAIREDESVVVRAPLYLAEEKIQQLLEKRADWILAKRQDIRSVAKNKIRREYHSGATLPYLGEELSMEFVQGKKLAVELEGGKFCITLPQNGILRTAQNSLSDPICVYLTDEIIDKLKTLLKKWYKKQAKDYTTKRVAHYARQMGVKVASISIKSRKKQWGTCDSNGELTFNWRLAMAAPEAIDYVVVHELCHRRYMDHSPKFWGEVKQILPDYKERQEWLEKNSVNMNL